MKNVDYEMITSLEDVKKVAELVLKSDPDIVGWEFTDKVHIGMCRYSFIHHVKWSLKVLVNYHGRTVVRSFIFRDGDYSGKLTRVAPDEDAVYKVNECKRDREYHSFEVATIDGIPVVKTIYHFPEYPWEKSESVRCHQFCHDQVVEFWDKPTVFLDKDDVLRMVQSHDVKNVISVEPRVFNGVPFWLLKHPLIDDELDGVIMYSALSPHIQYDWEHLTPIGSSSDRLKFDEIEIGKEYPLYRLGNCADVSTDNLLSVTFDGEKFNFIRPSVSKLI